MENTSHARSKWSREARLPTTTTVGWWLCRLQPPCATGGVMFLERVCVLLLIGKAQGETAMAAMVVAATRHRRPPQGTSFSKEGIRLDRSASQHVPHMRSLGLHSDTVL
ncbi:uncharacterized protein LOC128132198 isoform X1 [Lactuca sativa]|uniref:uncharacterized protein LOC128132198 isoform X1 n=1 Tax=Lactuca sativa TaxID=4236 RepID=UPI0022AFF798|nr:uncharacterized protein LOC128132198 isoform X1 [Lactuca sativa]